jgi:hypothetical protein
MWFIIVFYFIVCLLVGYWNKSRGNSYLVGFFISVIFSPLVGIILILITKKNLRGIEQALIKDSDMKKCPKCAELIKLEAIKCRYCGTDL